MGNKTNRSRLISLIHAQKTAAALDDESYRAIVSSASGKQSCSDCTMKELNTVFSDLNAVLTKQGKETFSFYPRWEKPSLEDAVTVRAQKVLGNDWHDRLDSFAKSKFNKDNYRLCDNSELRRIMAFLTNVERKERTAK